MRYLIFLLLLLFSIGLVTAQPVLYMSPESQQVAIGAEFDVAICMRDLPGGAPEDVMKSFSITVGFDPDILEVVSLTEGTFLSDFGSTWSWTAIDNNAGTAQFDNALLSTPFAYGTGELFIIQFQAKVAGTVNLTFLDEDLRDGDNYPLVHDTETATIYSGDAHLFIDPVHTVLGGPTEECTIEARIRNGYDIRGIKIILTFDPTLVEVVSVTNGTFMKPPGYNTFASHAIRDGEVEYNESIMTPSDVGVEGEGLMFSVTFRALDNGLTPVAYKTTGGDYDKTQLTDVDNQYLDYTTEDGDIEIGPIGIELYALSAKREDAHVLVEWSTASEINTVGFFVNRASADGDYERVHNDIIAARGTSRQGAHYQFIDQDDVPDDAIYKLEEICCDGVSLFYGPITVEQPSGVAETKNPNEFLMAWNYPNPFNPTTNIHYHVPVASRVLLTITDARGHIIRTLRNGFHQAGQYDVLWDGTDNNGESVASGLYIFALKAENEMTHGKMLLIK